MHTVVKGDVVNEIGGFRDTKVWGPFDHLELEKGDSEIYIKEGNKYATVYGNVIDMFMKTYELSAIIIRALGVKELELQSTLTTIWGQNTIMISDVSMNITSPDLDIYTNKMFKLFSKDSVNILSSSNITIQGKKIDLNGNKPLLAKQETFGGEQFKSVPHVRADSWTPTESRIRECK